jgi:beta-1,4-mannosyl-glycoprotein beta-1,4-N-acetylglucosaminyltransferase
MKIFDCCIFFDEKMLLDLRINILNQYVDKFVVVEANFTHSGKYKKFNFNINDYYNFKDKIIYIQVKDLPNNLFEIKENLTKNQIDELKIKNALIIENFHRDKILKGLIKANNDDLIIISDVDEIPNLENLKHSHLKKDIILFKQDIFYYKFNLKHPTLKWFGSKAIRKNKLKTPQTLRNTKNKIYPLWRLDTLFSKKKKTNISIVKNGGWHFTNIKKPENIYNKFLNFLHHVDFEQSGLQKKDIENFVEHQIVPYGHNVDKKKNKWLEKILLEKVTIDLLPNYLASNLEKYKEWIAN